MNRTKSIFALFISVLVILTSIIQYHFHDAEGNIHLLILDANYMKPHVHNLSSGVENEYICEHHHHKHNNCNNSDCACNVKLSIHILNKEFSLKHYTGLPIIQFNPANELETNIPEQNFVVLRDKYLISYKIPPFIRIRGLRAPPVA